MTDQYLTTVLDEAERVAKHHEQVAQSSDNPNHEYLRYAVLRLLEDEADETSVEIPQIDSVTVGYGQDKAMYESWDDDVEWWETVPPQEACTRFRVFYPDEYEAVPQVIVDVMATLGASRVWTGSAAACGSYDHRERREVHYLWPEDHPVEEVLHEQLSGPAEAVAPAVAERATFATDWSSTRTNSHRTISSPARSVPSLKRWTSRSSRKVAATKFSPRPETGTKSTSSTSRVPALTGSSAHPKAALTSSHG